MSETPIDTRQVGDHERWVVQARTRGCHDEPLPAALEAIDDWRAERHARAASCRVGARLYRPSEKELA